MTILLAATLRVPPNKPLNSNKTSNILHIIQLRHPPSYIKKAGICVRHETLG